ncbi:MAG TPA: hypothetical protein VGK59_20160 [Ohtaekwangia sp.]
MIKLKMRFALCAYVILSIGSIVFYSCVEHDLGTGAQPHPVDCTDVEAISYNDDVKAVITANCLLPDCHGSASGIPNWGNLSELQDHTDEIQRRITLPDTDPDKMPRTGSITQEERETIYCWIEQGAQDN